MKQYFSPIYRQGYTLIETLVATAVIMVAIGAASSLSLSMITQEEMSERTVRAINHLENAATLYRLGFDGATIDSILPNDPAVNDITYNLIENQNVTGLATTIDLMEITVSYSPSPATQENLLDPETRFWSGGERNIERTHSVQVFRSNP